MKEIVLVDDSDVLIDSLKRYLEGHDYQVHTCSDSAEALAFLKGQQLEHGVVISDCKLNDGMGGPALQQRIGEDFPGLGRILMSSNPGYRVQAEQMKIPFYLKGDSPPLLVQAIEDIFEN